MAFNQKGADFWLPNFGFKRSLLSLLKGQLQRFDKLSLFDRFRLVENRFDINF